MASPSDTLAGVYDGHGGPDASRFLRSRLFPLVHEEVRRELAALHPDNGEVVVHARGTWRVKGIVQVARAIGDVYLKTPEFKHDPAV
ncbi:hypothetical protein OsI_06317 [Oryza sativa Indica Group]|uniref:protein-serine/threonine phosphatase n=1 Tax=Oryza sativa subsp. indica TaxID=39946 RepID=B8ADW0_ORYSI|nr:hypothetical protein OsI_06317 [Oryza sativa Indica Group]